MNDSLAMHILEHVQHLGHEVTASILAHATEGLADIKKQSAGYVLEQNIDEV